ncbi:MAG: hypothetical protein HZB37_04620 [Planctomycetes bacterium]|nr:hypothetical protein [Planctomycetota bacterium]
MNETNTITHDWRDILRAFKMAFDPKKALLGYAGLLASIVWCLAVMSFFSSVKMISASPSFVISLVCYSVKEGVPFLARNVMSTLSPMDFGEFFVLVVLVVGLLVIWAMVGGAITRIAALDFARDESIRLVDALRFARKKLFSYFWSPLVPLIGVFFFALCNVIGGLFGRIPVLGELFIALAFQFAIVSGFLMVFIGVIGTLGTCFMFPTISVEGSDAFDAMSRAYTYVISRPKQFLWYYAVNAAYGFLCLAFVSFVAWLMIHIAFLTVGIGMGEKFNIVQGYILQKCSIACLGFCTRYSPEAQTAPVLLDSWSLKFLAGMLMIYIVLIKLAVWTFLTTYVFSSKTIIYFLLRKDIDNTVVADVHLEEVQQEPSAITAPEKKIEPGNP